MNEDDDALVQAFRAGDIESFAKLIERHRNRAISLAVAVVGDGSIGEDVVQEACYQAYFQISRLREPARFGAWLCGIAVNLAKMVLRERRPVISLERLGSQALPMAKLGLSDPQHAYEAGDLDLKVQLALELLPPDMRAAIWLHYVEGMSYGEASATTGASAGKLRVLSHRARQRLRQELDSDWRVVSSRKERIMEVTIDDVWIRNRADGSPDPVMRSPRWAVPLRDKQGDRALLLFVGREANEIAMQLAQVQPPWPQTLALVTRLLAAANAKVDKVTVTDFLDNVYLAQIDLRTGRRRTGIDARPSDALNLALSFGAPIFVEDALMAKHGIPYSQVREALEASVTVRPEPDGVELEWTSEVELVKRQHAEGWGPFRRSWPTRYLNHGLL